MAELEVYPGLVAAGSRRYTDAGGRRFSPIMALALWHLVRHLDTRGAGRVPLDSLKAAGLDLWNRNTYYRALRDAEALGLVEIVTRKRDGVQMVEARGIKHVAGLLEMPNVGARKVAIPLEALSKAKAFKAALWSAWQAGRTRKTPAPITRRKMRQLAGLPESTQRAYEHVATNTGGYRVTASTPNAIVIAQTTSSTALGILAAAREFIHGGCYIDRHTHALLRPIGNTYKSSLATGSHSRARKLNRLLSHRPGELLPPGSPKRLFYADARKAEQAARKGHAEDVPLAPTGQRATGGVVLWAPVYDSWSLQHVAGIV